MDRSPPVPQMRLTCNIDRQGRKTRLVGGVIIDVCGVALIVAGVRSGSRGMLVGGIVLCLAGSFMIFEGARGWCALRALGIKTPM